MELDFLNLDNFKKVALTGVFSSLKAHIISYIQNKQDNISFIICEDDKKARQLAKDLEFFMIDGVYYYPSKDIIFYSVDIKSQEIVRERFRVLDAIINNKAKAIVLSIESLFDRLVKREIFQKFIINFKVGQQINLEELTKTLIFMGYERSNEVEVQGQFAIRGGIIDIFSPVKETAFRIELWDDEIDSIRILDSFSHRSVEKVDAITIYPVRELVYTQDDLQFAIKNIKQELESQIQYYNSLNKPDLALTISQKIEDVLQSLQNDTYFSGIDKFINHFYKDTYSLIHYLPKNSIIYFNEPSKIENQFLQKQKEFFDSIENGLEKAYFLPSIKNILFSYDQILNFAGLFNNVYLSNLQIPKSYNNLQIINFDAKTINVYNQNEEQIIDQLYHYKKLNYITIFLASNTTKCEALEKILNQKGLTSVFLKNKQNLLNYDFKQGVIYIVRGNILTGYEIPKQKIAILSDLQDSKNTSKKKNKKFKGDKIQSFTDLKVGDYVVHENHGIGIFKGIEKIVTDGVTQDYLMLVYSDDGKLYVPINQMDIVQKYVGSNDVAPKLNKLGTKQWANIKSKAKKQIELLAKDLIKLYAKRQSVKGFSFSKDNIWQKEFEDSFMYTETDDQLNAIADVKADMESSRVMDRLICGDVGFGKTEVAIRAIFKAVQDNKQVAFLVPTTILAQQHYTNFCNRMQKYPIRVDLLSRFRTKKQQNETLSSLEKGFVDILVGTQRILSKDVNFKNLGLIVIDEEQRFGVKQKEQLKQLKENVDVLTLSATPIPRTLHMSMTGIRDMSLLEEPPRERIPIQTYVLEYDEDSIKTAINREINRNGQVYYLYNSVLNIEQEAMKIQNLVPNAKVSFAHGQMSERELEKIMLAFLQNDINVLVCTTIIETGLDIPNVNTIIIQNADKMGLSQLYQLRGRVGRSDKSSFAYLMYNKNKVLKEVSEKRLQTIKEFTEFGSGFKIAMRDLEIRGAGNLLGAQQHGHMELIGYELYCKILQNSIKQLKGQHVEEDFETLVELSINAFIPPTYIKNEVHKLQIYKKISLIKTLDDFYDIQDELEDRFGNIPTFVQNLLDVALMKSYAHNVGVTSIIQRGDNISINFKNNSNTNLDKLANIVSQNPQKLSYRGNLNYKINKNINYLVDLKDIFQQIVN